jgi:hypothetical protein
MLPNDDIELQVLWACKLAAMKRPLVSRSLFEDGWLNSIDCPCDEYGIAIRNLRRGIRSPWSGRFDNYFVDGLGAAIRSELWAFLAPGDPPKPSVWRLSTARPTMTATASTPSNFSPPLKAWPSWKATPEADRSWLAAIPAAVPWLAP